MVKIEKKPDGNGKPQRVFFRAFFELGHSEGSAGSNWRRLCLASVALVLVVIGVLSAVYRILSLALQFFGD